MTVRKKYGYTLCATKGSNKVVACSKANWDIVRDGSFILIGADNMFYKVMGKNKFAYEKEVDILNDTQLKINEPIGPMLSVDDDVALYYHEYIVDSVEIDEAGEGYEVGDTLTLESGTPKYNSIDETDELAQVKVTEISGNGNVSSIELLVNGKYNVAPDEVCSTTSNLGTGARMRIVTKKSDATNIEERTISQIDREEQSAVIHLNHNLPPRLHSGKIKVTKWELILNTDYIGDSKNSVDYDIVKDFTPYNNLPLINADFNGNHLVYNEAISIIDQKIKDIEARLS